MRKAFSKGLRQVVGLFWIGLGRFKVAALEVCVRLVRRGGQASVAAGGVLARLIGAVLDGAQRHPRATLVAALVAPVAAVLIPALWMAPAPRVDLGQSLDCLALNIYHEARGEPEAGQIAVGQVVMNRVEDGDFPGQVCAVITQGGEWPRDRCQFSWWCDGRSDRPRDALAWKESRSLARQILEGALEDPTRGALWYHATHVAPQWRRNLAQKGQIGRHIFYAKQPR